MEAADREAFGQSLRRAVGAHGGAALDAALVDLEWEDALARFPREAVATLFELLGHQHSTSSTLGVVLAGGLGLDRAPAAGVVLPSPGQWCPPGHLDGSTLTVNGLGTSSLPGLQTAWLVARRGDADVVVQVPLGGLDLRPIHGIDPELGLVEVRGTATGVAGSTDVSARWADAVALCRRAVGYELVGAATKMLELACQHARERVQFGQPISRFQAVRHRLAETLVAVEAARAVLDAAWEDDVPASSAVAKALAGRSARTAARHCQQVLAGIGFTTEHEFQRYARRVFLLDQLFGNAHALTREFGTALLAQGRLPDFAPL